MNRQESSVVNRFVPGVVLSIIILSWFAWIYRDLSVSLWLDEWASWWVAHRSFIEATTSSQPYPPHPSYYGLLNLWIRLWGESELSMRLLSVALVLHSAFLLAAIAVKLFPVIPPLVLRGSVLTTTLWSAELLTQHLGARPYAMGLWAALLSIYFLIHAATEQRWKWVWFGYAAATSLALLAQVYLYYLFILHLVLFWAVEPQGRLRREWWAFAIYAAASGLVASLLYVVCGLPDWISELHAEFPPLKSHPDLSLLAYVHLKEPLLYSVCLFLVVMWVVPTERRRYHKVLVALSVWAMLPHIAPLSLTAFADTIFMARYASFRMAFDSLFFGVFAAAFLSSTRKWLIPLGIFLFIYHYSDGRTRVFGISDEPWREASQWILERQTADSLVVVRTAHVRSDSPLQTETPKRREGWVGVTKYYGLDRFGPGLPYNIPALGQFPAPLDGRTPPAVIFFLCRNRPNPCDDIIQSSFEPVGYKVLESSEDLPVRAYLLQRVKD